MAKPPHSVLSKPPKWLDDYMEEHPEHAGAGLSNRIVDNDIWRADFYDIEDIWGDLHQLDDPWIEALQDFDDAGDKKRLARLLTSDAELPPYSRFLIADLIDRYQFEKKPGRPRLPIYDRSHSESLLLRGTRQVRRMVQTGSLVKDAIDRVATELGIDENTLANAVDGKRGSTRRIKKRLSELQS